MPPEPLPATQVPALDPLPLAHAGHVSPSSGTCSTGYPSHIPGKQSIRGDRSGLASCAMRSVLGLGRVLRDLAGVGCVAMAAATACAGTVPGASPGALPGASSGAVPGASLSSAPGAAASAPAPGAPVA